jgi:hypothetical protein
MISFLFEHDLFGKPVSTFPDHALVPPNKAPSAERTCSRIISGSTERTRAWIVSGSAKAACIRRSDKAPPEIDPGRYGLVGNNPGFVRSNSFLRALLAQIAQQCVDALMIALNCCAWTVQLQEAR